ncbi:Keratin, Type Ii Cytoskeletal 72 [Manis pentadactyla]|nr:Keratin, Type Ii Cytoskeletal 72 [Manis pentadactyla]
MESRQSLSKLRKNNSGSEEDRKMVTPKGWFTFPTVLLKSNSIKNLDVSCCLMALHPLSEGAVENSLRERSHCSALSVNLDS